ncbi:type II toxin-antitoxin system VapC family toxin [Candidatus Albibeggiatoa sp. nov. BB20]|uniref:type II toxin-antitoxin system VapC family toxin n=1 Tax=Candidatus Albibeggiatoa sp. nov. BB20 TaxID=3162723 RepID=UPI0033655554
MNAIDTNLLVRLILNDDETQVQKALAILNSPEQVWIAKSVLLELEWVLRGVYKFEKQSIYTVFIDFLDLENIVVEQVEQIELALNYYREGMDFGDAIHLVSSLDTNHFYTFDKKFVNCAKRLNITKPKLHNL